MSIHHRALTVTLLATMLAAQEAKEDKVEPVALVSRAEKLLKKKEVEDAVLVLWQALDLLAALPGNAVHDATTLSARFLLNENDPHEARRRATFTSVGKQQVDLAAAYRAKKWLDTAATRLDVADRYDRDAGAKERAALEAAKARGRTAPVVTPKEDAKAARSRPSPLLQRASTSYVVGEWRDVDGELETPSHTPDKRKGGPHQWVCKATHEDNEVVVEWKPLAADKEHNAGLWVGHVDGPQGASGFRVIAQYYPATKDYSLTVWRIDGQTIAELGTAHCGGGPTSDGYRRLAVRVTGTGLRAQIDDLEPLSVNAAQPVRGCVGLVFGLSDEASCGMRWRNLRIDPLPADRPTDEEARAKADAESQNEITRAVDEAKELLAKKQPEPASLLLRDALDRVAGLPAGVLRDNLHKSIEQMLAQADPIAPRRRKTAQAVATELVALADEYANVGMVRVAVVLVEQGAAFDPEGQAARLAAAQDAVRAWNVAQAAARASELAPPADDGAVLREWFAKGRKLDTYNKGFAVDDASARAEAMMGKALATWAPQPLAPKLEKFSVYAHLPAPGVHAGVLFDVVDSVNFGVVFLVREAKAMRLYAYLKIGGKWVPLLQRDVAMDAWRRDGWHQITVEANATGLLATCGNAKIQVPRKLMGKATGVPGLYAWSETAEPVTVEFRAFAAGK